MAGQGEDTDPSTPGSGDSASTESSDGTADSSTDASSSSDEEEDAERHVDEQQIAEDEEDLNRLLGGGSMRVMTQALGRLTTRVSAQARHSLGNALRSIDLDTQALLPVLLHFGSRGSHICANLRNGPWYVDSPSLAQHGVRDTGQCYFKSTDGHVANWAFNTTRLNLTLALQAASHKGAVVVDSTRKGKSFPDALTFTLPLWCHVINLALHQHYLANTQQQSKQPPPEAPPLVLPPWVPPSHTHRAGCVVEEGQWVKRLQEAWTHSPLTTQLLQALSNTPSGVPLRLVPYWVTPWDFHPHSLTHDKEGEVPIICVTASQPTSAQDHRERHSWVYVQGAGDDEEHWAQGLTPTLFHTHKAWLMEVAGQEEELRRRVHMLVNGQGEEEGGEEEEEEGEEGNVQHTEAPLTQVGGTDVWVGGGGEAGTVRVGSLSLRVREGSRWRDEVLPTALREYVHWHLSSSSPGPFVCVCSSGGAESVIVALAILSAFYTDPHFTNGPQLPPPPPPSLSPPMLWWPLPVLTKDCLRTRLIHLQALLPPCPQPPPRRLMKQLHKLFEDHRTHPHNIQRIAGGAQGTTT